MVLGSRPLQVFALCGALFHMANASMLGLVSQKMALGNPGQGIALTAASAIAAQSVMVPVAALVGARADAWGRKPLFLAAFVALALRGTLGNSVTIRLRDSGAFVALALRGTLYTLSDSPAWLIGVQLLDGVGAGLIGALFPIVIADLTRGSGHFAVLQGVVGTVHGVGGMTSMALGGALAAYAGYNTAFVVLAAIGAAVDIVLRSVVDHLVLADAAGDVEDPHVRFVVDQARDDDGTSWLLRSVQALRPCAEIVVVLGAGPLAAVDTS